MCGFNITEELMLDRLASRTQIEFEYNNPGEVEHEYVGDCVFCGTSIYDDDTDYLINDDEQLGICAVCMDKCHWR